VTDDPAPAEAEHPERRGQLRGRRLRRSAAHMALAVLGFAALLNTPTAGAMELSPLNGTPDASPYTQISFLGVAPTQISGVSVVGSHSGAHSGQLEAYASAPGASFVPAHPFTPGETVSVNALVGPKHTHVSTTFVVAYRFPMPAGGASSAALPAKPGSVWSFASQPALQPPSLQVTANSAGVAPGDVFLTPTHGYGQSGAMIVDGSGQLVWFSPAPRGTVAENLQVEEYEHKPALVWWQGYIADGVGFGTNVIYNTSYQPVAQVKAGNGYQADLHAIQLTSSGSAYITAYTVVRADLAPYGGLYEGKLQDAVLQQIDVKTGLVMFEWHAYGHVPLEDSFYSAPTGNWPWDFFHLNAISLDPNHDGNFVISARNTWAAYEISHHTGGILWTLGGKHSSFHMGPGTGTAWQHDVRWQPDGSLTIFDNGAVPKVHSQSRVLREKIDFKHDAVTLVGRTVHTPAITSGSQGDDEVMPNGDSFVGWGEEPYLTEFSASGKLLFEAHLTAPTQSYRAFRYPWTGTPATPPSISVKPGASGEVTVYASWNGATQVSSWQVLAGPGAGELIPIASSPRRGFETAIPLQTGASWFAVQALDANGKPLGVSLPVQG
jgi:hypothetical protein